MTLIFGTVQSRDGMKSKDFMENSFQPVQTWLTDRQRVDTLRGFACLLLVLHHTILDFSTFTGQALTEVRSVDFILSDVRMPMFSFIAGLIFAYHSERSKSWQFIEKKAERLLLPFVVTTLIIVALKTVYPSASVPVTLAEIPYLLVYGYSHLWFLQAIFLIFCFYALLNMVTDVSKALYGICFVSFIGLYLSPLRSIELFSIGQAFYLAPFFTFGILVTKNIEWISSNRKILLVFSVIFFVSIFIATASFGDTENQLYTRIRSFLVGLTFLIIIYLTMPRISYLYRIGAYSFTIFLFHSIFIALGVRLVPETPATGLLLTLSLAIFGSISLEVFVDRFIPAFRFGVGKGFR